MYIFDTARNRLLQLKKKSVMYPRTRFYGEKLSQV